MRVINSRGQKWLSWSGLIVGILGAGGLTLFVYSVAFDWMIRLPGSLAWFDVIACGLLILGSVFVAWKRPGIGGVILIASNILVSVVHSALAMRMEFGGLGMLFFEIPAITLLLVSGVLFLLSWWRGQKQLKTNYQSPLPSQKAYNCYDKKKYNMS